MCVRIAWGRPNNMKQYADKDTMIASIEAVKKELEMLDRGGAASIIPRVLWFKLNSCLYSQYPHPEHFNTTNKK